MIVAADYPLLNIFWSMMFFFLWVLWIWMIVFILADVFGRHDIGGWAKAGWTLFIIVPPFFGALKYIIGNSASMAERKAERYSTAGGGYDVKGSGTPAASASELPAAIALRDSGAITEEEFVTLRAKALAT